MRSKDIQRWESQRQRGQRRFVLTQGVLWYGLPMFVIMTFVVNPHQGPLWLMGVSLLLWLLGGALFGWLLWQVNEWRFRRACRRAGASAPTRDPRD